MASDKSTTPSSWQLLNFWKIFVFSWKYPRTLESSRVSSPGLGNNSKMMTLNGRYSTGLLRDSTPNKDQYLAVTAKRSRWSTSADLSSDLGTIVQGRPCIYS
ncbi:hypothetical protein TNCV_3571251 [Trichonephila clavipes]|nr:hypothetical protein TNCV_3571251 [Trichonephila clavipes]